MQSTKHKVAQRSSLEFRACDCNQRFFVLFSSCCAFIASCLHLQTHTTMCQRNADSSHSAVYWKLNNSHIHSSDMCRKREPYSNRVRELLDCTWVSIRFSWLEFPAAANQNKQIIPALSSFTSHINHEMHPIESWHISSPNQLKHT